MSHGAPAARRAPPAKRDRSIGADVLLRHLRRGGAVGLPPLSPAQWTAVVAEATRHSLAPLAFKRLSAGPARDAIPTDVHEELRALYLRAAFRNTLILRETAAAARRLADAGIPSLLLKGTHLAAFVYADPALRTMADIDLLVPADRLRDAEQAFVADGWGPLPRPSLDMYTRRYPHIAPLTREGSFPIEIHWHIERPTSPFRIDPAALWARATTHDLDGVPVRVLQTEDLLLHLCLHASYHHRFDRSPLKALVDVATVAHRFEGEIDWDAVTGRANAWGAGRFTYCTLRLARDILDAAIPAGAFDGLAHASADEEVIRAARQFIVTPPVELPVVWKQLGEARGFRQRVAWLTNSLFLQPERMRRLYGLAPRSWLVYPYYLVRPFDLLIRRGLLLARVMLRTPAVRPTLERERGRARIQAWVDHADGRSRSDGITP